MSLVIMLLSDALEKGGPGSGPKGGGGNNQSKKAEQARKATIAADKATQSANSSKSHLEAAKLHEQAAQIHNDASKTSQTPQLYQAHVSYHNQMAASHKDSAK